MSDEETIAVRRIRSGQEYPYDGVWKDDDLQPLRHADDPAYQAARGIAYDIGDRAVLKWEWCKVDDSVRRTIIDDFAAIIKAATPNPDPSPAGYGEACDSCGRSYGITYRVPDDIWLKIAPNPQAIGDHPEHALGGLLCPDCASSRAKALGVTLRFNADTDWPGPSPVCVEAKPIEWDRSREKWWLGDTPFGRYQIFDGGYSAKWGEYPLEPLGPYGSMEAAEAACQADFTRRTLELVNARSVESVRAELMSLALGSEADNYARYDGHVAEWLRTLTEGEG